MTLIRNYVCFNIEYIFIHNLRPYVFLVQENIHYLKNKINLCILQLIFKQNIIMYLIFKPLFYYIIKTSD